MEWKRSAWFWFASIVVHFYTTFVLQCLWGWFAVPLLHAPELSYWGIYGLSMLISLLISPSSIGGNPDDEIRWRGALTMLDFCIPEHRRAELSEQMDDHKEWAYSRIGSYIFAQFIVKTTALLLGWVVSVLASA